MENADLTNGANGDVLGLASQMLRIAFAVKLTDPDLIQSKEDMLKYIRCEEVGYNSGTFVDYLDADFHTEADEKQITLLRNAEKLAIALFFDITEGGGSGEPSDCGPTAFFWKGNPDFKSNVMGAEYISKIIKHVQNPKRLP